MRELIPLCRELAEAAQRVNQARDAARSLASSIAGTKLDNLSMEQVMLYLTLFCKSRIS